MLSLLHNQVFLLLLIVVLGEALGRVRLRAFSLESAAIIFVAMAFGHAGYTLGEDFLTLGLALFIYSVGLQAGPGFVASFRADGARLSMGALGVILIAAALSLLAARLLGLSADFAVGLFAGSLSSTPGLAVAVEAIPSPGVAAAYGVTYGLGVISVVVFITLLPRLLRINVAAEEAAMDAAVSAPRFTYHHIEVTNPNLFGKKVSELHLRRIAPVVLTRLLRAGAEEPELVSAETVLAPGDRLRIAGREADLARAEMLLGRPIEESIEFNRLLTKKALVVSRPSSAGRTLGQLNLFEVFSVQATRITRNGLDVPAQAGTMLRLGDVVHVVGEQDAIANVAKMLGNDLKSTERVRLLPLLSGLLVGFFIGKIPLALPLVGDFTLGATGGVLAAGLLLGHLYKTGPLIWELPSSASGFIRELGLMFFLAAVGTRTGATIAPTLAEHGLKLLAAGALITTLTMALFVLLARATGRFPFLRLLGVLAGGMTSTPGVVAAGSISATSYAAAAFATVYPVALVGTIVCTKLLVWVL